MTARRHEVPDSTYDPVMEANDLVCIIGDDGLLVTVASTTDPGQNVRMLNRSRFDSPEHLAAAVAALQPASAIVLAPQPGEGESLALAGVKAAAWLVPPVREREKAVDLSGFTRVVASCPSSAMSAGASAWTLLPLPVSDTLFSTASVRMSTPRPFFDGPTSERRDRFLQPIKHRFDVLHLVSGATESQMLDLMSGCEIAVDLQEDPKLPARDRIGPALASGMLVLTEGPLSQPGLVDGEHLLTFSTPDELELLISDAIREPESFASIRTAGREMAESRRSSRLIAQINSELTASS